MIEKVIKRDGKQEVYSRDKVHKAIGQAFKSCKQEMTEKFIEQLDEELAAFEEKEDLTASIEDIQDMIEKFLIKKNKFEVAKAYILYRDKRTRVREQKSKIMKGIKEKLEAKNVQNQNANVDEKSFGGRVGEATRIIMKDFALWNCMSEMARNNHLNNEIYIHDLDSYASGMHNCLTIPFDDLLAKGFKTRQTDVRPAKSINTAMQLIAVIFQLQSLQQFGGVSASHIDWTMVPYVRMSFYKYYVDGMKYLMGQKFNLSDFGREPKETSINDSIYLNNKSVYDYAFDMTARECHQAVEGMYHNLNTLQSRSGNQLPFTSINYGTCTSPEGRLVTKTLLDVSIEGLGEFGRTSIFPCGIFQCMKGVNRAPGDPNYDLFKLALKSTSQRIYPNYCNCDTTMNEGYDRNDPRTYYATMGCRTVNGLDINGLGQQKDGRGNVCPVTIILPTIAMEAKLQCEEETGGKYDEATLTEYFMKLLETKIGEAKDMLIERFNWICKQPMDSAKFMYENGTMAGYDEKEGIISALKHGTLTIGLLGMNEAAHALYGTNHFEGIGKELTDKVVGMYVKKCKEYKEALHLNFAVYYTPAENLCHTALKNFRKKYGIIPGVSDRDYFTNSIHVPVWIEMNPFEKIDIESQWANKGNGGTITYVELPSTTKNNIEALETLVNYAMDKDIPYFAINLPLDCCENCGYQDEIGEKCPKCGSSNITRLRRVTGYLTGNYTTAFNKGKINETDDRVKHIKN